MGNQTATIVTGDNDKVLAKLAKEDNKILTISITSNLDVVFGELNGKLEDIKISIKIGLSLQSKVETIQKTALNGKVKLVGEPIDFEVTATLNGETVSINHFENYVDRSIVLPDGIRATLRSC